MPSSPVADPAAFPSLEPDILTVPQAVRSEEYKSFLKYVAQSTGVISYEQLAILYPAICQGALEWMLKEKKSVDFGFVILHPAPHRANWKQIMLALFPAIGPALLGKSSTLKKAILEGSGFFTKLLSGELLAVANERYIVWGIEPELKRGWWRAALRIESYRFSQLGSVDYASYVARTIVKLKPKLTRAYLSFLRQVAYPCAAIKWSRSHRRRYIVPLVEKNRVRPVVPSDIPTHTVVPRDPEKLVVPTLADCISTSPGLPEVSDIRREGQDLRITQCE